MEHVDIVIISYTKNQELYQMMLNNLHSLFTSEDSNIVFHVFVIESNLHANYDDYNNYYINHTCKTYYPNQEFGYHKYCNIGRKLGRSPYVVLCNSDITYGKNWASNIINVMKSNPDILSASPWCPQTFGDNNFSLNSIYYGYRVRYEVAGWCIFQQRKIYDIIGDLDEQFKFWYCDNDYAMQLMTNGIKHCLVPNSVVNHHSNLVGSTAETLSEKDKQEYTYAQQEIFNKKWARYLNNQG